jgi:branched-chain amino acid transport system ATP-binding protein
MSAVLAVRGLSKRFGGLAAVDDVSFEVEQGEIFAIIGPNGAGKTTTLNLISGLLVPTAGSMTLHGRDLTSATAAQRCHAGLGRAFQVVQPFPEMTVRDNVLVGALFGTPGIARADAERRADHALEITGTTHLADRDAEELTLMEEKRLEIARALATAPTVLLLDEVMAGLRPAEAREAVGLVRSVRDEGVTVVFIEHVMPVVRDLADRVLVMDYGKVLTEGRYAEVTQDARVIEAYLGRDDDADDAGDGTHAAGPPDPDDEAAEGKP